MRESHQRHTFRFKRRRSQLGFTAMEVTMVATIISILALIALPTFLGRLRIARITAAQDEMSQIARAQQVVFADTGHHFRLQDLDNVNRYLSPLTNIEDPTEIDRFVPSCYWDYAFLVTGVERSRLVRMWEGAYMVYQVKNILYRIDIRGDPNLPQIFSSNGGPVLELNTDNDGDVFPIDPWGTPYLFFGQTTDFYKSVIYSLGPDGLPGDGDPFQAQYLYPVGWPGQPNGSLGLGDDIIYQVQ